jgi:integral membrane sensor domain MASE1
VFVHALQMGPGGFGGLGFGIVFVLYLLVVVGLPLVVTVVGLYLLYGIRQDVGRMADAAERLADGE